MIETWTITLLGGLIVGLSLGFVGGVLLTRKNACWTVEETLALVASNDFVGSKTARRICARILHIPEPAYELCHPQYTKYNFSGRS